MNHDLLLANSLAVGLFGGILSAAFCGALETRRSRWGVAVGIAALAVLQAELYIVLGATFVHDFYPLITHLPLALLLCALTRRWLWSILSVLMAYLCCHLRYCLGLIGAAALQGIVASQAAVELAITLPLLLLLLHFLSPAVCSFAQHPPRIQWRFGLIPAIYYAFDYLVTVYTDLLFRGIPVVLEFMPFVCCVAYLAFLLRTSAQERERSQLEQIQNSLNLQVSQSLKEISALRESQQQTSAYRHDLRHHLQYLSACIENDQLANAQTYIHGICAEIEAQKLRVYCENETANLIFSSFAGRCAKEEIALAVQAVLPSLLSVSDSDLCVLLSNALENALNACRALEGERRIEVQAYEKGQKVFLQITNPCPTDVVFEKGIPVTRQPGHGVGVRSICAIVERYGGVFSFSVRDGRFVLRLSL